MNICEDHAGGAYLIDADLSEANFKKQLQTSLSAP
jgi:hypothetical protein